MKLCLPEGWYGKRATIIDTFNYTGLVALVGPNGSGKSAIIHGIEAATTGVATDLGFRATSKLARNWPGDPKAVTIDPPVAPVAGEVKSIQGVLDILASSRDTQLMWLLEFWGRPERLGVLDAKLKLKRLKEELEVAKIRGAAYQDIETNYDLLNQKIKDEMDRLATTVPVNCVCWHERGLWDPKRGFCHPDPGYAFSGAESIKVALEIISQLEIPLNYICLPDRQYDKHSLVYFHNWARESRRLVFVALVYMPYVGKVIQVEYI
jgi:hypothetical protein